MWASNSTGRDDYFDRPGAGADMSHKVEAIGIFHQLTTRARLSFLSSPELRIDAEGAPNGQGRR
jgi:hypothetical protein